MFSEKYVGTNQLTQSIKGGFSIVRPLSDGTIGRA